MPNQVSLGPVNLEEVKTMADVEALVKRVLTDDAFAQALVEHPEETLREVGVEPTPEMLEALANVDVEAVRKLAASFDQEDAAL
jgi:hypothetical protein